MRMQLFASRGMNAWHASCILPNTSYFIEVVEYALYSMYQRNGSVESEGQLFLRR